MKESLTIYVISQLLIGIMHSESESLAFIQRGDEILGQCRPRYIQFLDYLKFKLGEIVSYGNSKISLDYASFYVLRAIALDHLEGDEQVVESLRFLDDRANELRELLMGYDGEGRFMSLNHITDIFYSNIPISSTRSTQLYVKYKNADLQWLIYAYDEIVLPKGFSHKPYNQKLYLIMDIDYICRIFSSHMLKFTMVNAWEDPYENVFLRHVLPTIKGSHLFGDISKQVYGESWSTKKKSDAMWRIYSSKASEADGNHYHSAQLCTTVDKLIDLVSRTSHPLSSFGHITYDDESNSLFSRLKDKWVNALTHPFPPINALAIESLYYKRNCFDHEKEFRATIWIDDTNRSLLKSTGLIEDCGTVSDKFLNVPISNPNLFFEKIILDPRLVNKSSLKDTYKDELRSAGVNSSLISMSDMYEPPIV